MLCAFFVVGLVEAILLSAGKLWLLFSSMAQGTRSLLCSRLHIRTAEKDDSRRCDTPLMDQPEPHHTADSPRLLPGT